ncbi:hypothetical protein PISL3812_01004 [Talaromyces islandicus]|uniref:Non-haem dioxygenase N-terminal domain-containing protein n=1 Tax=Talaromyces islandicus TaxID=28573 RepID=A0A0U1LKT9_TALIS|nr:hypothetical protein PISL3812_01004 [Talaromyces islandicus]
MMHSPIASLVTLAVLTTAVAGKSFGLRAKGTNTTVGQYVFQTGGNAGTICINLLHNSINNPNKVEIDNNTNLWINGEAGRYALSLDMGSTPYYGPSNLSSYSYSYDGGGEPVPDPTPGFSWGSDGILKVSHKPFYGWVSCNDTTVYEEGNALMWATAPIKNLSSSFINTGFFQIANHDMTPSVQQAAFAAARRFFALHFEKKSPLDAKKNIGMRGYGVLVSQNYDADLIPERGLLHRHR